MCPPLRRHRTESPISTRGQALDDALARLARLHPKKIDLSLGRLQRLLTTLGNPQDQLPPIVHVAGTNGKGSTCAFLAEMARANGERVHIYTSPHLVTFNERILLDSRPVDDRTLIEASAKYSVNDHLQIYLEGKNLTDEPEYYYFGAESRLMQYDEFGSSWIFGARYTF